MSRLPKYEKPDWFDLHNYNGAEKLSAKEWAIQLIRRRFIIDDPNSELSNKDRALIRNEGLIAINNNHAYSLATNKKGTRTPNVWSTTCDTVYWQYQDLSDEIISNCEDYANGQSRLNISYDEYCHNELNLGHENYLSLTIDLSAPDSVLIDEFKKTLPELRKKYSVCNQKEFTSADAKRWADSHALPLLDIIDWEREKGIHIPNHVIGEWLFPDTEIDAAEKIRKVTRPIAKILTSWSFLHSLDQQA